LLLPLPASVTLVLQAPPLTVAVPTCVVTPFSVSNSVTVAPGATVVALTVPEMVGVAWLVVPPVVDIVTVGSVSATVTAWLTSVETWP
ncbi:MAG TPA: hypothetical protein VE999_11735, partial [Gemmataceae bacterium]|nr:hypothetical protein [Gemmataceae bacterium]